MIGSVSKWPLCYVDADVADGRPSKSVAFQLDDEVADYLLQDGSWLVCQMPGSCSRGVPDQMVLIMVPLNWNRLHGGELAM